MNGELEIGRLDATIEFEPEAGAAAAGAPPGDAAAAGDLARLRELLRPLVIELLEDELARYTRMRG
jgi:hypothetical protein